MKRKKSLSFLLALALVVSVFAGMSVSAFAVDTAPWADGDTPTSKQAFYTATKKIGTYEVYDDLIDDENSTYDPVTGKGIMVFYNDLTELSSEEFMDRDGLTSIIFPSSLTYIGLSSLWGCTNLVSVTAPGVNCVDENAFYKCTSLKYIYAPADVAESLSEYSLYKLTTTAANGSITVSDVEPHSDCATYIKSGLTVTVAMTANTGYKFNSVSVTDANSNSVSTTEIEAAKPTYEFTMPGNAVDVSATFTELATTGDVTLDLEDGDGDSDLTDADEYADHMDITQYYIKTTNSETTTNNRVQVSWASDSNLTFKVNDGKKWDPTTLAWVTDSSTNGKATLTDGNVTTFTFKNFSTKAFTIVPTFTVSADLSADLQASYTGVTYDQTSYTVNAIEVGDDGVAAAKYFSDADKTTVNENALPTANVVATLRVDQTKFDNAAATSSAVKYGTFTFTLTAVDAG